MSRHISSNEIANYFGLLISKNKINVNNIKCEEIYTHFKQTKQAFYKHFHSLEEVVKFYLEECDDKYKEIKHKIGRKTISFDIFISYLLDYFSSLYIQKKNILGYNFSYIIENIISNLFNKSITKYLDNEYFKKNEKKTKEDSSHIVNFVVGAYFNYLKNLILNSNYKDLSESILVANSNFVIKYILKIYNNSYSTKNMFFKKE